MRVGDVWGEWADTGATAGGPGRFFTDDHCPNCHVALGPEVDRLFCSSLCQQMSKHVRYWRRVSRDGRYGDPEVRAAVEERMASMGYPADARRLSPSVQVAVKERDGGLCVGCGAPGDEIDHIKDSSSELSNLQLLCKPCHRTKTAAGRVPASEEHQDFVLELLVGRVMPDVPVLLCDDEQQWDVVRRPLKVARRKRLELELVDRGFDRGDFPGLSWAEIWEQVYDEDADDEPGEAGYGPDSYFARAMQRED